MRPVPSFEPAAAPACPKHPGVPSVAPCARCGTFLCTTCVAVRDPPMCSACAVIAQDPLGVRSTPFGIGASISGGWKMFRAGLPVLAGIALVFGIPSGLIGHVLSDVNGQDLSRVTNLFDGTIGLIGLIAALWTMAAMAEGRRMSTGAALQYGASAWGRVFVTRIRAGLWILLYTLLLIVPGVIKALALLLSTPMAVLDRDGDPIASSQELTQGSKAELLGLCFAGGLIVFGVVIVPAILAGAISELVPALGAVGAVALDVVARLAEYLFEGMVFAAYFGLKRSRQLAEHQQGVPTAL